MVLNVILLALLVAVAVFSGLWARRAALAAFARGRREAELELGQSSSALSARAEDLAARLAAAEARLIKAEEAFREMQGQKGALESSATSRAERIAELEAEVRDLRARREQDTQELREAARISEGLKTELREAREGAPRTLEAMKQEFEAVAAKLLKEKGEDFSKQNLASLDTILSPLKDRLKEFEKKVEDTHREGRDQHVQLKTQIEGLLGMNQRLSSDAQNLAAALKGENKTSGNWGEIVLERVLEMSGLEKGREYDIQQSFRNEEGQRKQPDVVVYLPEQRQLIIDAKVSLVAYERYCTAETPEFAGIELQAHIASVRQHVRSLADQRYQDLPGLKTPDFVFLFMPVEPAFILAVKEDDALFREAFERNIVIVSPSTLLATLRTVESLWKLEYRNRNADEIARLAGALHDKFVGFLEDLEAIGDGLSKAQGRFEDARRKLKDGKGNLVGSIERIRLQGARSKKRIPASWREAEGDESADEPSDDAPTLTLDEPRA